MTSRDPGTPEGPHAPDDGAEIADKRRQLINLTLERRPALSLERLRAVLVSFDLDVDDDTLVADLDSLGFAVEEGAVVPRPGGPPEADAAGLRGALGPRAREVAIASIVLVVAIVIGLILLLPDDDDDAGTTVSAGGSTTTSVKERAPVAPSGPGSDPALAAASDREDFERADGPLGRSVATGEWQVVRGTWSIRTGQAMVERGDEPLALATIELGTPDVRAQVTLPSASKSAGLAFRIVDDDNYWLWTIAPDFATFILTRVDDGTATNVGNSGLTETKPGATLGVHLSGTTMELLANGVVVKVIEDDAARPGTRIGLATTGGGPLATFDDLILLRGP